MFINRLISEIGGWFRVVAGQAPRLRLNIKVLFQSGPSARRPFSQCVIRHPLHTSPRTHLHTNTHMHTYVNLRAHTSAHAYAPTHARALTRATDRSGIFPLDWNLIKLKICQFRKKHPTAYIDGGHYTRWPTRQNSLA